MDWSRVAIDPKRGRLTTVGRRMGSHERVQGSACLQRIARIVERTHRRLQVVPGSSSDCVQNSAYLQWTLRGLPPSAPGQPNQRSHVVEARPRRAQPNHH